VWVQCILCERYIEIDDETTVAKRFRKRPDFAYLCSRCGGALGEVEKNVLPPGQRPEEIVAGERAASPTFAAWSEPKTARQRPPRGELRGDAPGASPRGVVELPRVPARTDEAPDRGDLPREGDRPREAERPPGERTGGGRGRDPVPGPRPERRRNEEAGGKLRQGGQTGTYGQHPQGGQGQAPGNGQPGVGGHPAGNGLPGAGSHPGGGRSRRHRGRHGREGGAPSVPSPGSQGGGPASRPPRPES